MEESQSTVRRLRSTIWTVWGFLSGTVGRYLRPEVTTEGNQTENVQKDTETTVTVNKESKENEEEKQTCNKTEGKIIEVSGVNVRDAAVRWEKGNETGAHRVDYDDDERPAVKRAYAGAVWNIGVQQKSLTHVDKKSQIPRNEEETVEGRLNNNNEARRTNSENDDRIDPPDFTGANIQNQDLGEEKQEVEDDDGRLRAEDEKETMKSVEQSFEVEKQPSRCVLGDGGTLNEVSADQIMEHFVDRDKTEENANIQRNRGDTEGGDQSQMADETLLSQLACSTREQGELVKADVNKESKVEVKHMEETTEATPSPECEEIDVNNEEPQQKAMVENEYEQREDVTTCAAQELSEFADDVDKQDVHELKLDEAQMQLTEEEIKNESDLFKKHAAGPLENVEIYTKMQEPISSVAFAKESVTFDDASNLLTDTVDTDALEQQNKDLEARSTSEVGLKTEVTQLDDKSHDDTRSEIKQGLKLVIARDVETGFENQPETFEDTAKLQQEVRADVAKEDVKKSTEVMALEECLDQDSREQQSVQEISIDVKTQTSGLVKAPSIEMLKKEMEIEAHSAKQIKETTTDEMPSPSLMEVNKTISLETNEESSSGSLLEMAESNSTVSPTHTELMDNVVEELMSEVTTEVKKSAELETSLDQHPVAEVEIALQESTNQCLLEQRSVEETSVDSKVHELGLVEAPSNETLTEEIEKESDSAEKVDDFCNQSVDKVPSSSLKEQDQTECSIETGIGYVNELIVGTKTSSTEQNVEVFETQIEETVMGTHATIELKSEHDEFDGDHSRARNESSLSTMDTISVHLNQSVEIECPFLVGMPERETPVEDHPSPEECAVQDISLDKTESFDLETGSSMGLCHPESETALKALEMPGNSQNMTVELEITHETKIGSLEETEAATSSLGVVEEIMSGMMKESESMQNELSNESETIETEMMETKEESESERLLEMPESDSTVSLSHTELVEEVVEELRENKATDDVEKSAEVEKSFDQHAVAGVEMDLEESANQCLLEQGYVHEISVDGNDNELGLVEDPSNEMLTKEINRDSESPEQIDDSCSQFLDEVPSSSLMEQDQTECSFETTIGSVNELIVGTKTNSTKQNAEVLETQIEVTVMGKHATSEAKCDNSRAGNESSPSTMETTPVNLNQSIETECPFFVCMSEKKNPLEDQLNPKECAVQDISLDETESFDLETGSSRALGLPETESALQTLEMHGISQNNTVELEMTHETEIGSLEETEASSLEVEEIMSDILKKETEMMKETESRHIEFSNDSEPIETVMTESIEERESERLLDMPESNSTLSLAHPELMDDVEEELRANNASADVEKSAEVEESLDQQSVAGVEMNLQGSLNKCLLEQGPVQEKSAPSNEMLMEETERESEVLIEEICSESVDKTPSPSLEVQEQTECSIEMTAGLLDVGTKNNLTEEHVEVFGTQSELIAISKHESENDISKAESETSTLETTSGTPNQSVEKDPPPVGGMSETETPLEHHLSHEECAVQDISLNKNGLGIESQNNTETMASTHVKEISLLGDVEVVTSSLGAVEEMSGLESERRINELSSESEGPETRMKETEEESQSERCVEISESKSSVSQGHHEVLDNVMDDKKNVQVEAMDIENEASEEPELLKNMPPLTRVEVKCTEEVTVAGKTDTPDKLVSELKATILRKRHEDKGDTEGEMVVDLEKRSRPGQKRRFEKIERDDTDAPSAFKDWSATGLVLEQASSLDFRVQKSKIAVKNPLVRPPKDPRTLINMASVEPLAPSCPPKPSPLARSQGEGLAVPAKVIGFKLPGLGAGIPVLRKTEAGRKIKEEGAEQTVTSETPGAQADATIHSVKQEHTPDKPKWTPPRHPGMGNPMMMSELKSKLKKTAKE